VTYVFDHVGDDFQKLTKYKRDQQWMPLDWSSKPEIYKTYPEHKTIPLEFNVPEEAKSFSEILQKRKSIRNFSEQSLTLNVLSFLLWASTGVVRVNRDYAFRTAPSAGALYPIETYLVAKKVENLPNGVYHYNIASNALEELKLGDFSEAVTHAALEQDMCNHAPVTFVWSAIFSRSKWKYKQRAYRYVYLDAGHIAENLVLAAVSLGLGSCQIGAIFDDEVNKLIDVDGEEESAVYLSVVGYPNC
jgi:SagB-type dehydrogenase family enzyme